MSELKTIQYSTSSNYSARIFLHYKFSSNKYPWPLWVFDNIQSSNKAKVLEIGCGNGLLWKMNLDRIPSAWDITMTDFSEGMLKDAENFIGENTLNIKYEVMDAENISYEDKSFDVIFANHMMYHIPDRGRALSEIRRVLKDNGIFYVTTMEGQYMSELSDIVREFRSLPLEGKRVNTLINNFSLENGEEQLKEYFSKIKLKVYENRLIITEAEPFSDYAVSLNNITPGRIVVQENVKDDFTKFVENIIKRENSINISSNAGIFICSKF